jgi:hypothetical protein
LPFAYCDAVEITAVSPPVPFAVNFTSAHFWPSWGGMDGGGIVSIKIDDLIGRTVPALKTEAKLEGLAKGGA